MVSQQSGSQTTIGGQLVTGGQAGMVGHMGTQQLGAGLQPRRLNSLPARAGLTVIVLVNEATSATRRQ